MYSVPGPPKVERLRKGGLRPHDNGRVTSRPIWPPGSRKGMQHVRGAPYHPQTQGKIERWHQTLKNRILLDNYYLPGDHERQIGAFVEHYNHVRYHESIDNLTPADVYFGRAEMILPNAKASNDRPSQTAACSIDCRPLKL